MKNSDLSGWREQIDEIDQQIITLLAKRHIISQKIGEIKSSTGQSVYDPQREKEMLKQQRALADKLQLEPEFITEIYQIILQASKKVQTKVKGLAKL
ncbi:MAG TPA: chorismate mutase [Candidatus Dormibacteraeota bacterium]|nr:chorismate mutase [Candidatus Dormibacteraeota bacterium]